MLEQDNDLDDIDFGDKTVPSEICGKLNPLSCIQPRTGSYFLPKTALKIKTYSHLKVESQKTICLESPQWKDLEMSDFVYSLINDLDALRYGSGLQESEKLFIGYIINYAAYALYNSQHSSTSIDSNPDIDAILDEFQKQRRNTLQAFEDELLTGFRHNPNFPDAQIHLKYLAGGERKFADVKPIFNKVVNKIYRDLYQQIKSRSISEDPALRVLARVIYLRCLHCMDLSNPQHFLVYYKWKPHGKVSIPELECYLKEAPLEIVHDDILRLVKNFMKRVQ